MTFGNGGQGEATRDEMVMYQTALGRNYPLTPQIRSRMVERAAALLEKDNPRAHIAAIKALAMLDCVNVKREAMVVQERHNDILESASAIRTAMQLPGVREELAKLTESTCGETGQTQQGQGNSGEQAEGPIVPKGVLPNGLKELPATNGHLNGKPYVNGDGKHG